MSAPFILRPIATFLLTVAVMLLGVLGYRMLPITALPNVDFPTIVVTTGYPGASPRVIENSVTAPLEHALGQISGLETMSSVSAFSSSEITLRFSLARDIDLAGQDVQAAINASAGWLPSTQLPSPPIWHKVNPADTPVVILALTSDTQTIPQLTDLASVFLTQRLSQILGVGAVTIEGGLTHAIRLQIDPVRLAGMGLSMEDVRQAVTSSSSNTPKGTLDGTSQAFQLDDNGQLLEAAAYDDIVVAYRGGAPVYVHDLGQAISGLEDAEQAAWLGDRPAVILDVQKQPGANVITVVDAVQGLLPALRDALPRDAKLSIVTDRSASIRVAIADLQWTLVLTVALVVLVIFLFLRRVWATVIPSVTLPVSIIATFGGMALLGFSLDNLSLMALTVASGFVVDDGIVMLENIVRYIEMGQPPLQAALNGARQIGFTVVSLTISLVAVLIPLLLMTGLIGRLFREFAITLSLAIAISAVVSLTLTPMMCAVLLRRNVADRHAPKWHRWSEAGYDALAAGYARGLDWVLGHRNLTLGTVLGATVLTALLFLVVPKGFLPQEDTGLIAGVVEAAPDISFAAMSRRQRAVVDAIRQDPAVRAVDSFVGVGAASPALNVGHLLIDAGSPEQRREPIAAVMDRLGRMVRDMPGVQLRLQVLQTLRLETRASSTQYQYLLQDLNEDELQQASGELIAALKRSPLLRDVAGENLDGGARLSIEIDREAAARFGLTLDAVDETLYDAFGQRQIDTVYGTLNQYHVILEATANLLTGPAALDGIFVKASGGTQPPLNLPGLPVTAVPLSAIAAVSHGPAKLALPHEGLFPSATISFNVQPGVSLGAAVEALEQTRRALHLPDGVMGRMVGVTEEFKRAASSEGPLILAAIVTVYIVLGVLYESFIHPLTILSTLPSAGVGALAALMLCGMDLNVVSLIGIILLIGIVKKNAIMMVDFAIAAERHEAMSPLQAIRQAAIQRFRPIMMTTAAALLGALPLALSSGTGSELRRPLGVAIVGGLLVSQFITLYTTPVVYLLFSPLVRPATSRQRNLVS